MRSAKTLPCILGSLLYFSGGIFVNVALTPQAEVLAADTATILKSKARDLYYGLKGQKNQAKAFQLYLQAADMGDPEAQYIAGGMYFKGIGTTADYSKAFSLLLRAAQKGVSSAESQLILAQGYFQGKEVPRNYQKAIELYKKSAADGNAEAQNELGYLYYLGKGVEQNAEEGAKYFREAALNGLATAQYNYGLACYSGNGVPNQDSVTGYAWINLAAAQGHQAAISVRELLEQTLSEEELRKAQLKAEALAKDIGQ